MSTDPFSSRAAGFESAMALCAVSDLERAATDAQSATNRIHRAASCGALDAQDLPRIDAALGKIRASVYLGEISIAPAILQAAE